MSSQAAVNERRAVSVIIPAYERTATLPRAIASVLAQPGIAAEIIVIDDGSPNPIRLSGPDAARVRIVRSAANAGPGAARNLGVELATNEVVAFLDADDEWLPGSAVPRLRLLEPGICVVGRHRRVDDLRGSTRLEPLPRQLVAALQFQNPIHPSSIIISRSDFERIGGFPEDRDCAEDWVLLLRALKAGVRIRAVTEPVLLCHIDRSNTTIEAETSARHALGAVRLMEAERLLDRRQLVRARRVVDARVAGFYANSARMRSMAMHLRRAAPGALDPPVARELLRVPVQALRGAARRRWRDPAPVPSRPKPPPLRSGPLIVITGTPAEAWVMGAVRGLAEAVGELQIVRRSSPSSRRDNALFRWRVRRSGEPDASEVVSFAPDPPPVLPDELANLALSAALIVDLSGNGSYRPNAATACPVVRVRFGPGGALRARGAFDSAPLTGRTVDHLSVTLEWGNGSSVLRRAPVVVDQASRSRTANVAMWKAAATVPRAVGALIAEDLHAGGSTDTTPALPGQRAIGRVAGIARLASQAPRELLMRVRWGVAIAPLHPGVPTTDSLGGASAVWVDDKHTLADPCLFESGETTYLFAERVRPGQPGVIAAARIGGDGRAEPLDDVLVDDHHLSYPMVFEDDGEIWLVPESGSAGNVRLFHAEDFPHKWSHARTLIDGIVAFDPTLHRNPDGYWLWVCVAPFGCGRNDELWLFHSRSLFGPWRPHPANPVVDDPRSARPAGSLLLAEGRLIRPSQDCSTRYGHRIVLNEVLELSERRYRERPIGAIEPDWWPGLIATHTISRTSRWQALDGARRVVDPFSARAGAYA